MAKEAKAAMRPRVIKPSPCGDLVYKDALDYGVSLQRRIDFLKDVLDESLIVRPWRAEAELHHAARVARQPDQFIRDYRDVHYVTADAELTLAPEANPADDGTSQ